MSNYYAAIGSDGTRLVVWGAGDGVREALTDARRWLSELPVEDRDVALTLEPISECQMVLIAAGMIGWAELKTKKACTPRGES
jgi:hypothetical protein